MLKSAKIDLIAFLCYYLNISNVLPPQVEREPLGHELWLFERELLAVTEALRTIPCEKATTESPIKVLGPGVTLLDHPEYGRHVYAYGELIYRDPDELTDVSEKTPAQSLSGPQILGTIGVLRSIKQRATELVVVI